MDFLKIKTAVEKKFDSIKEMTLFRSAVTGDELWECYLASFPEGTNPIFRERTEHDCQCCRSFIRSIGNIIAVDCNGKRTSIWETECDDENYQMVLNAMAKMVLEKPIENIYLHYEGFAGVSPRTFDGKTGEEYNHFYTKLPSRVYAPSNMGERLSNAKASHDVFLRSLNEITDGAVDIVLELIGQNSLYRGEEQFGVVSAFAELKHMFGNVPEENKDVWVWLQATTASAAVARIRNTAIGTLLTDLSEGKSIEDAVRSFESKVAPANYKRPTALITKAMVEKAKATIESLGLTSALERRYAVESDISINDVLFVNRLSRPCLIGGSVMDVVASEVNTKKKVKSFQGVEEVGIEKFIADILPTVSSVEVLVENRHINNLVSLIAPSDITSGKLFKWNNNFSWSYNGNVTDSIKEKVKAAGGNVSGDLCCRLAWWNYDDLDLSMIEPNGNSIYYCGKHSRFTGGRLDVDMNAGVGSSRSAVENIYYKDKSEMMEGIYTLVVHNFCKRETIDVGFEVEIDFLGNVQQFAYDKAVGNNERITVAQMRYSHAKGLEVINGLSSTSVSKKVWGINTETFVPVSMTMLSPNYWEDSGNLSGNKHYFFMLQGCENDGSARGIYNEFLRGDLDTHRKVFEVVGNKVLALNNGNGQLSGIGFSSTVRNHIVCRVTGSFTRVIKVLF